MNLLELILKQLRQRSLSTVLTILSVALGVALATAILIVQREGNKVFGQSEYGFDLIVGPKGSKLQLVLNNVYQVSEAQSTIPYRVYTDLTTRLSREVRWATPIAMGDNFKGHRLIATQPKFIETPELASVRASIREQVDALRPIVNLIKDEKRTPKLPIAPNAPELPKLFAIGQAFRPLAARAEPFDPETKIALETAANDLKAFLEAVSESSDRKLVVERAESLLNHANQSVTLVGGPIEARPGKPFELASGKSFAADRFECVVGSEVAQKLNIKLGDPIKAEHGLAEANESGADEHDERWTVVGILKPTATAFDRVILIPLSSFYAIPVHEKALGEMAIKAAEYRAAQNAEHAPPAPATTQSVTDDDHADNHGHDHAYHLEDGKIVLEIPREEWKISSILVNSRGGQAAMSVLWDYSQTPDAMAVSPALEMRTFFDTFLRGSSLVLLMLAILVTIVAAVSILVSIYNSISARRREIAILRALGATRRRILTIICLEAGLIGLIGSICGIVAGIGLAGIASAALTRSMGQGISWSRVGPEVLLYCACATVLAMLAGLVPALKAYSTPVADGLVSE